MQKGLWLPGSGDIHFCMLQYIVGHRFKALALCRAVLHSALRRSSVNQMDVNSCAHHWQPWEHRSYWLQGGNGDGPVEWSWVRWCTVCGCSEYRRLSAAACPDNADHHLRGWLIPPRSEPVLALLAYKDHLAFAPVAVRVHKMRRRREAGGTKAAFEARLIGNGPYRE